MKYKKILLLIIFIQGVMLFIIDELIKVGFYIYNLVIARTSKEFLIGSANLDDAAKILYEDTLKTKDEIKHWKNTTPNKLYRISSYDKTPLYGRAFLQKKRSKKWAIVVHGYYGYGEQMCEIAKKFYEDGFNVLLPDCRGHGKSGGIYIGMGWHDRLDILAWIKKIIRNFDDCEIVLYGLSMGGATVLMTSGEVLPKNVKCIIEDCGYTSVSEEFAYQIKCILKYPYFPFVNFGSMACKLIAGYSFREASAIKQVKKCKVPILFIHGKEDSFVPTRMAYKLFNAANCEKDLLIIPKAGHGVSFNVSKDKYWKELSSFVNRFLEKSH